MAIVRAVKSGNWSDPTVWNTGTLPTSADDVYSNTFTVTIDVSPTVLSIQNGATTGVTAGGTFIPTNGITLTCTGAGVVGGSAVCFTSGLTSGQSCSVVASCTSGYSVSHGGLGTLNIVGDVRGGSLFASHGVNITGNGIVNITGTVTGGSSSCHGVFIGSSNAPTVSITGNVLGSPSTSNAGVQIQNAVSSSLVLSITGNCTAQSAPAVFIGSTAVTATIIGTMTAANNLHAFETSSLGAYVLSGPFIVSSNGTHAVFCRNWKWQNTTPPATYYQIRSANLATIRPLYTADSVGGNPAITNVRSGTVYGPAGELTGTCAVPPAGSVALGVPVDNTTGTAAISAASIRSALGLASANLDTQLAAIPTAAAIRAEIDASSTKLDATISSRLATSDYTAPPSVTDIATAVWSAATRTLTTAIDNSSTIAAAVWSAVTRTLTTNPGPSAADNASAVRQELSAELGRIDATISSRVKPADTLARVTLVDIATSLANAPSVPSPQTVAQAVRTELTQELQRVANAATTQEVGDIVEGAVKGPDA